MTKPTRTIGRWPMWSFEFDLYRIKKAIDRVAVERDPFERSSAIKKVDEAIILLKQQSQLGSVGSYIFPFLTYSIGHFYISSSFWRVAFAITLGWSTQAIFVIQSRLRLRGLQKRNWTIHDSASIPYIVDQLPSYWRISSGKPKAIADAIESFEILLIDLRKVDLDEHLNEARTATLVRYCRELLKQPILTSQHEAITKDLLTKLVDLQNITV